MPILKKLTVLILLIVMSSCGGRDETFSTYENRYLKNPGNKIDINAAIIIDDELINQIETMNVNAACATVTPVKIHGTWTHKSKWNKSGYMSGSYEVGVGIERVYRKYFPKLFKTVGFYKSADEIDRNKYDIIINTKVNVDSDYDKNQALNRKKSTDEFDIIVSSDFELFVKSSVSDEPLGHYKTKFIGTWQGGGFLADCGEDTFFELSLGKAISFTIASGVSNFNNNFGRDLISFAEKIKKEKALPSELLLTVNFDDNKGFLPNSTIDAGEHSEIIVMVENHGKGSAYDVTLEAETKTSDIVVTSVKVGDISPGQKKSFTVPVSADISLKTGTTSILIKALEKRGYDSRPVQLKIATTELQRPALQITSYEFNDASGLSQGDGDSRLENNETIELISLVQNTGVGPALGVIVGIKNISDGIEIIRAEDDISTVGRNDQRKAKLAFKIPRTYSKSTIDYTLFVTDVRGIKTEKIYSIPFALSAPVLGVSYQVFDDSGREVPGLENGKSYLLKVTPTNGGNNSAEGVRLSLLAASPKIKIEQFDSVVGNLAANRTTRVVTIPFSLDRAYISPTVELLAELKQDDFPSLSKKITLPVIVHQPDLEYGTTLLNGINQQDVMQNTYPKFRVSVRNNGNLNAEGVSIHLKVSHPTISYEKTERVGTIISGEGQYRDFAFFVRGDTDLNDMSVSVVVEQADFDGNNEQLAFHIKPQTAMVQEVVAVGGAGSSLSGISYYRPPQIYINSPNKGEETFDKVINLHGNILAVGAGNAIEKLTILVNKKPVQLVQYAENIRPKTNRLTQKHTDNKLIFDGKIALVPDVNKIEIRSVDRNNQEHTEIINVVRKARLGDIYAVVIGISEFANTSFDLKYAASDSQKFYDFLKSDTGGKVPQNRMKLLVNENANRAAIIKALTRFLGMAGPDDTVELYLATHGVIGGDGVLYYLTHNTEMNNLLGTAFSSKDLENIVGKNIQAGRVIIYLDACHSGQSGLSGEMYAKRSIGLHEVNQANNSLAAQLSKYAKGVTTFSASSAQGFSNEDDKWGGGVFTYHLLKGLNGAANDDGNEWVSISELDRYLASEVRVDTNGEQQPKMNSTLPGDTPVAHLQID